MGSAWISSSISSSPSSSSLLPTGSGGNRQGPPEEDLSRKIERFICLKAPTFDYSDDPLDADDWLKVIETKLDLTNAIDEECVSIATHQLMGAAKAWWDSFCDTHPDPAHITWDEFSTAFRDFHIPAEVMENKAMKFRTMTQGHMKVEEYFRHFTKMMRYAPGDTGESDSRDENPVRLS